jgi:hypothetical protein
MRLDNSFEGDNPSSHCNESHGDNRSRVSTCFTSVIQSIFLVMTVAWFLQEDGTRVVGQCEISHPVRTRRVEPTISITDDLDVIELDGEVDEAENEDGGDEGPSRGRNVFFEASAKIGVYEKLRARINRKLS